LKRLTAGKNKALLGRDAGLKDTTFSSYIATKSIPRADIALKMARVLGVPLAWLADEDAGFPYPESKNFPSAESLSDGRLLDELARRYRRAILDFFDEVDKALTFDWSRAADEAAATNPTENLTPNAERGRQLLHSVQAKFNRLGKDFDLEFFSMIHHDLLPGADRDFERLTRHAANEAWLKFEEKPDISRFSDAIRKRPDWAQSESKEADDINETTAIIHAHLVSNQRPKSNQAVKELIGKSRTKSSRKK
jgi:transcriptional regulator with XRE-family HTH domain